MAVSRIINASFVIVFGTAIMVMGRLLDGSQILKFKLVEPNSTIKTFNGRLGLPN
jgi:hypothetical protein